MQPQSGRASCTGNEQKFERRLYPKAHGRESLGGYGPHALSSIGFERGATELWRSSTRGEGPDRSRERPASRVRHTLRPAPAQLGVVLAKAPETNCLHV